MSQYAINRDSFEVKRSSYGRSSSSGTALLQTKDGKTPVLFRKLENQDVSIPANVCFVVKKIEDFNAKECIASVALTTIMRIKCTNMVNRD